MKNFISVAVIAAFVFLIGCEKPQSDVDRNAQVDKEVQARLDAEHQAQEKDRLAQQQADLDVREKALVANEKTVTATEATVAPRVVVRERDSSSEERGSQPSQSYETFYQKLEPYGAWRESADYGYVFQPKAAQSRNWRPYTDGRWAYTDAGWTWISDEPFGWATYHYGRWSRLSNIGWVWVPGDEWAPAWVSWRKGDQNVGWAPLPPEARFDRSKGIHKWADNYYDIDAGEYVFVPNEEIGAENIERAAIPADRNVTIVNETTNVTNITYSNTTIVNEGPSYEELREHSRRPVERLRLQREYGVENQRDQRAVVNGQVLEMVTPSFNARVSVAPRTAAPRIERTTVERNTSGEFERARQKMKSEATPPPDAPSKKFERPAAAASPATPVTTAAPVASATPAMTAPPHPSATLRPASTPQVISSAPPLPTAARVTPPPTVAPTSEPMKLDQRQQREEERAKALENNRRLRVSPTPAAETSPVTAATPVIAPHYVPTPRPVRTIPQTSPNPAPPANEATPPLKRNLVTPTPAAEASPITAATPVIVPRHVPLPRPVATVPLTNPNAATPVNEATPPLNRNLATPMPARAAADQAEGTPAGVELTPAPRVLPKRGPRPLPSPSVSPAGSNER